MGIGNVNLSNYYHFEPSYVKIVKCTYSNS